MLAPNNKIYISVHSGVDVLHIIHQPNEKGLACEVEQHGLQMLTYHGWHVPNFPHFRLFDLPDSPCDTLGINTPVAVEEVLLTENLMQLYPNPAATAITISFPSSFTGQISIVDLTGKQVLLESKLADSLKADINISDLPDGIYILTAVDALTNQAYQQKLVVRQ